MIARMAWRNLWRRKRRTAITLASISLGLACVVFFLSMAEGVYAQLVDDAVRMMAGHITIENEAYRDAPAVDLVVSGTESLRRRIERIDGVVGTKLLINGQGIARSGRGSVGVSIIGVEPEVEATMSPLARKIVAGRYLQSQDENLAVIGSILAERLELAPGKKLVLATNDRDGNLIERLLRVVGVFRTGAEEVDGYIVQARLADTRGMYGLAADEATQLGVLARPGYDQPHLLDAVSAAVGTDAELQRLAIAVRPWQQVIPELAAFIRIDRVSDHTFQGLLVILVLSTILNTLVMAVLERERELGVMLSLGTSRARLGAMVLLEAAILAALGCTAGLMIGGAASGLVQVYGWDVSSFYPEGMTISGLALSTTIYARVTAQKLLTIGGLVFVATVMLAVFPALRAARVSALEGSR